ncbi:MAG: dihydroneopterin aldolase [Lachnospiraceae bacterium]|nr:dihydroneopterin aldolase [Lachnospiraceae bacterium]
MKAGLTDNPENSVNQGEVCCHITDFKQKHTCKLPERVAELPARKLLPASPAVHKTDRTLLQNAFLSAPWQHHADAGMPGTDTEAFLQQRPV